MQDVINFGYIGLLEEDYEWVTQQLVQVANRYAYRRVSLLGHVHASVSSRLNFISAGVLAFPGVGQSGPARSRCTPIRPFEGYTPLRMGGT